MRLDILSFLIGFVSAGVLAFILYRFRDRIGAARENATTSVGNTRQYITTNSQGRYLRDASKLWSQAHIAGELVELTQVYVEPRFVRPAEPLNPLAEEADYDVFEVVPRVQDMPLSYAPYNIETLSVRDLQNGDRRLAVLGVPGLGKSTALSIIGLFAAGEIKINPIDLLADEVFEAEIRDLPAQEREKQIERRKQLRVRALEQLEAERKKEATKPTSTRQPADFSRLLPILVHLRDIDLRPEAYGAEGNAKAKPAKDAAPKGPKLLDPAEPIVRALQGQFGVLTSSSLPGLIYRRLADATCLVMIDGYDDLPPESRPEKLAWLAEFMALYGENFIIVAGPAIGFDPLLQLGFTPVYLRAWSDADQVALITRLATLWPSLGKDHRVIDETIMRRVLTNVRGRTPLDLMLKAWAAFDADEQEGGRRGWYDAYVRRKVSKKLNRSMISALAAGVLDKGGQPLTREQIKEIATAVFMSQTGRSMSALDDSIGQLTNREGLLVEWGNSGRFSFAHPLINAYLAAETLMNSDADALEPYADKPAWDLAFGFLANAAPIEKAVNKRLSQPADLLYSGLFSIVHWLVDAPSNAPWKADVFRRLTAALLAPAQYPLVRERAMAALVSSRDHGVTFIFRQALRHNDPLVRRMGCIGLGAHGDPEVVKDLDGMVEDANLEVKLAAGMAMGAIGNEFALEAMVRHFVYDDQHLRRAVAETLAAIPGEGQAVLREAITSSDMMLRHAAVFGLARVKTAWSLALLYKTLLEDEQWYVRNAANAAFLSSDSPERSSAVGYPEADKLAWLADWAAKKGDSLPVGEKARDFLLRSLQEGDAPIRAAAAVTLANLGHVRALKTLYTALADREEAVRAAAHTALGHMQLRTGEPFPVVG